MVKVLTKVLTKQVGKVLDIYTPLKTAIASFPWCAEDSPLLFADSMEKSILNLLICRFWLNYATF